MDRISYDFYNLVLFKKQGKENITLKIVPTEQMQMLPDIIERFFN